MHRAGGDGSSIIVRTRVIDDLGRTVSESSDTLDGTQFSPSGVASVRFELPLSTLPPGRYLLTMEALGEGKAAQRRDVPFSVR